MFTLVKVKKYREKSVPTIKLTLRAVLVDVVLLMGHIVQNLKIHVRNERKNTVLSKKKNACPFIFKYQYHV